LPRTERGIPPARSPFVPERADKSRSGAPVFLICGREGAWFPHSTPVVEDQSDLRAPIIQMRGVVCRRGKGEALSEVSLEVMPGELVFVTGPSGAGKSTLLGIIHGDLRVSAGEVKVAGRNLHRRRWLDLPRVRREVGMIYQELRLLPRLTALENVVFAVRATEVRLHPSEAARRALGRLEAVGMADKRDCYAYQLSGGEQQRLAIARAIAVRPRILLADEPTKNLDRRNVAQVITLLTRIARSGTTVLVATHDQGFMRRKAAQTVQLERGRLVGTRTRTDEGVVAVAHGLQAPAIVALPLADFCEHCGEPLPLLSLVEAGSRSASERWCPGCRKWALSVSTPIPKAARARWLVR
jgi:cell division transport system ATP-binding protein